MLSYICFLFLVVEKEMVTHSSIKAWKIPWTEEPDGLQSKVSDMTKWLNTILVNFYYESSY